MSMWFDFGLLLSASSTGGGTVPDMADIFGADLIAWWRSDLDYFLNGSNVASWVDQVAGYVLAQADAAKQPAFNASDAAFNGRPSITGDGVDDFLREVTIDRPAPATEATTIIAVGKIISYSTAARFVAIGSGSTMLLYMRGGEPAFSLYNGSEADANVGASTGGAAKRLVAYFSGSTSDYTHIGGKHLGQQPDTWDGQGTAPLGWTATANVPDVGSDGNAYWIPCAQDVARALPLLNPAQRTKLQEAAADVRPPPA
jgi:hypothetical protein